MGGDARTQPGLPGLISFVMRRIRPGNGIRLSLIIALNGYFL